jgi:hypothetical protein
VSFTHESVVASASVEVTDYQSMSVVANPQPSYGGSTAVDASTLARVFGTSPTTYQQASMTLRMLLRNGASFTATSPAPTYAAADVPSGSPSLAVSFLGNVMTARAAANLTVRATFGGTPSLPLSVVVTDTPVFASSFHVMQHLDGGSQVTTGGVAFKGANGSTTGRMNVGLNAVRTAAGNDVLFVGGVSALPGLVTFASSAPLVASIGAASGLTVLLANSHVAVQMTATAPGAASSTVSGSATFFCNLNPSVAGDVDLGQAEGNALAPIAVGAVVTMPLRVNTGGRAMGSFDIVVNFDATLMQVVTVLDASSGDLEPDVRLAAGVVGTLGSVANGSTLRFSGSIDNPGLSGSAALLVNIRFRAIGAGVAVFSGQLVELGDTAAVAQDIGTRGQVFVAGRVAMQITPSRRRLAADEAQEAAGSSSGSGKSEAASAEHVRLAMAAARAALRLRQTMQRSRRNCAGSQQLGDTNTDCVFSAKDVRFVTLYIANRGTSFAVAPAGPEHIAADGKLPVQLCGA